MTAGEHRPRRLNIDADLITRAAARAAALTGEAPTFRSTVALAVERELERVIRLLKEAGLQHRPGDKPRPRPIDDRDWDALGDAEQQVAVDRVGLIRCCLERLARGEDK
jgi:hypothetical protein